MTEIISHFCFQAIVKVIDLVLCPLVTFYGASTYLQSKIIKKRFRYSLLVLSKDQADRQADEAENPRANAGLQSSKWSLISKKLSSNLCTFFCTTCA